MAAAAILDFQNFHFPLFFHMHTFFIRKNMKFGKDQSTESKVALIFRNFCFGLNFPFEGLFRAVFGGRRPPNGVSYNPNPQKALPSPERRHLTPRSWKSADSCRCPAMTRKNKQKMTDKPVIFHPIPGGRMERVAGLKKLQGAWSPQRNHVCQMPF